MKLRAPYLIRVGDALSQLFNVALLDGDPNESISGRSFRQGWRSEAWIDALLGFGHCRDAFIKDVLRSRKTATTLLPGEFSQS